MPDDERQERPAERQVVPGGGAEAAGDAARTGEERVVIRDNRKINLREGKPATVTPSGGAESKEARARQDAAKEEQSKADARSARFRGDAAAGRTKSSGAPEAKPSESKTTGAPTGETKAPPAEAPTDVTVTPAPPPAAEPAAGEGAGPALGADLEALRHDLEERTKDIQRITAEYANYRKRVDRDRALVVEQATGNVLSTLLPILDDLDRARDHGDLVGPFGAVAEKLTASLTKFGLATFGDKGDPFDPTRHEAVLHSTSADVTEPTCVEVMRRGYLLGERMLRPALVAVAEQA